jgi:hypothetical protein
VRTVDGLLSFRLAILFMVTHSEKCLWPFQRASEAQVYIFFESKVSCFQNLSASRVKGKAPIGSTAKYGIMTDAIHPLNKECVFLISFCRLPPISVVRSGYQL